MMSADTPEATLRTSLREHAYALLSTSIEMHPDGPQSES
jgi:hypothetical protein